MNIMKVLHQILTFSDAMIPVKRLHKLVRFEDAMNPIKGYITIYFCDFLGGLSLHLNHLIASGMTIYDWPFGTLPFRLFGSNLDTRDLETYPRTYSGHF